MDNNHDNRRDQIISAAAVSFILLVALSLLALFVGPLMRVFGLKYNGFKHFILYFILSSVLAYGLNLFFVVVYGMLLKIIGLEDKINREGWRWSLLLLDAASSMVGFMIVDAYMRSVSANFVSVLLLSSFFAWFDRKKEQ